MSSYLVSSGVTSQGIILNGGDTMQVLDGGLASNTIVKSSGTIEIQGGGSAQYAKISSGGIMEIAGGGKVSQLYGDGEIYISGGEVIDGLISGHLYLYAGQVNNLQVGGSHGIMRIYNDGAVSGGSAGDNACIYLTNGGTMVDFTNAAYLEVGNSATASSTTLKGNGRLHVKNYGKVYDTEIAAGHLLVQSGGYASGAEISEANGICAVMKGGEVNDVIVRRGGNVYLYGGIGNDIVVSNGGLQISSGAVASNVEISSQGVLFISSGATLTGKVTLDEAAAVTAVVGAKINFDIADSGLTDSPLVNNLSVIYGSCFIDYTVTVSATQDFGTYALAGGVESFINPITVQNTDGEELGRITCSSPLATDEFTYTLKLEQDELSLTITTAKKHAASDIDGNNVSDVMFQYLVDNRIGYWMNGTSQWRSTGTARPDDWNVIGSYDMDADGYADAVMIGSFYDKGQSYAFVGYYQNGIDNDAHWVNIGTFANAENVEWVNAVGNITGNKNANSIVWHAPELGALGVWTDGTTNWVSLGSGFDKNWKMIGCGDFDGNGKDEVLLSLSGSLHTIDIDNNFVSLGNWGDAWEVCAIGDFTCDGCDDIVMVNNDSGTLVRFNHGQLSGENWVNLGQLDTTDWFVVGAGDYNGDKKDDLLVRQYSTGMLGYYSCGDMSKWVEMGRGVDMDWKVIA